MSLATLAPLAREIRQTVGKHYEMLCAAGSRDIFESDYQRARSESLQAEQLARYLAQHLARDIVIRRAFAKACGIRFEG